MIQQDVLGYRYDDAVPAFINAGPDFYWHRPTSKLYDKAAFDAWLTAQSKAFGANENGNAPASYVANVLGLPITVAAGTGTGGTSTTGATPGSPGTFTGGTPATLNALQLLGAIGQTTPWKDRAIGTIQQWVIATNKDTAIWYGAGTGPTKGWQPVTLAQQSLDITALVTGGASGWPSGTTPVNLNALKGNGQAGDGKGYQPDGQFGTGTNSVAFATGQYVILGDGTKAHYNGTAWVAGVAT